MAKKRYINTKFWNDTYISELEALERYLFLYFLTNEHSDICGIYELPMRTIAFETGVSKDRIEKILEKLTRDHKVFYINSWVYIKNFSKHQAVNDNMQKGIERSLAEIPTEIMDKIKAIESLPKALIESELLKPTLTPRLKPTPNGSAQAFEKFWSAYPKKRSKGQALKTWEKIKPNEQLQDRMFNALERAKTSADWIKDNGKYIPYPSTWLNAQGWEDVIVPDVEGIQKATQDRYQEALKIAMSECGECSNKGFVPNGKGAMVRCQCVLRVKEKFAL